MEKRQKYSLISLVCNLSPDLRQSGSQKQIPLNRKVLLLEILNKFNLDPIIDHFRTPARMVGLKATCDSNHYFDWDVSIMANSMRDFFLLSTWKISNELACVTLMIFSPSQDSESDVYPSWKARSRIRAHE